MHCDIVIVIELFYHTQLAQNVELFDSKSNYHKQRRLMSESMAMPQCEHVCVRIFCFFLTKILPQTYSFLISIFGLLVSLR